MLFYQAGVLRIDLSTIKPHIAVQKIQLNIYHLKSDSLSLYILQNL